AASPRDGPRADRQERQGTPRLTPGLVRQISMTTGATRPRAPRVGAGRAPALLLVDFARGWTEPGTPLALECGSAVNAAAHLLAAAREQARPVVFTTVAYDEADLGTV